MLTEKVLPAAPKKPQVRVREEVEQRLTVAETAEEAEVMEAMEVREGCIPQTTRAQAAHHTVPYPNPLILVREGAVEQEAVAGEEQEEQEEEQSVLTSQALLPTTEQSLQMEQPVVMQAMAEAEEVRGEVYG